MSIANKIKPKIEKVINKLPTKVDIYRDVLNEFNEPNGKDLICNVTGFYHEGSNQMSTFISDSGEKKISKQKFLMVLYDEKTIKIKENDYFYLDGLKHTIKDLGNLNRLNIYFDMLVEVD